MTLAPRVLVMAKAPVEGQVKTRLGADIGMPEAARLAAAALLDTLEASAGAFGAEYCHVALDGDLSRAVDGELVRQALAGWTVWPQHGDSFAARLVHAHADLAADGPGTVVQIGMDTPQVTPQLLRDVVADLNGGPADVVDAVLGPASDGGWWVLALRDSTNAAPLARVPMSTSTTCADTHRALTDAGLRVTRTAALRDVDVVGDAIVVARDAPSTRFAAAWTTLAGRVRRPTS